MARWPLIISVMRLVGTSRWRARAAALMLRALSSSARCSPGCIVIIGITFTLLVIVNNFDGRRAGRTVGPLEADPPLVIDADAVLPLAVSGQRFKTVTGQRGEVLQRNGGFQTVQFEARGSFDAGEGFDSFAVGEVSGPLVPVADYHVRL